MMRWILMEECEGLRETGSTLRNAMSCLRSLLFVSIRTKRRGTLSLTERDILQLFAELLTPPNRHRLPGGVLR